MAIVLAAFVLRLRGITYQLPQWTYWDGYVLLDQTSFLRGDRPVVPPQRTLGYYPYLTSRLAAALPEVAASRGEPGELSVALERSREPWVRIRLASLLLSLFAVLGTWGIARRFVSPGFALLAAALTATSLLHVTYTPAQRPHGTASGMVALAVWALLHLRGRGGWKAQVLAALGVGLAVSALQSSFALLVSWAIAWWFRRERGSFTRGLAQWSAGLAVIALFVRVFYPFHFDDRSGPSTAVDPSGERLTLAGHTIHLNKLTGRGFEILGNTFAAFDPLLTLLVVLALVLWLVRAVRRVPLEDRGRRHDLWICLGYVLPFVLVFGLYDLTFDRFGLPLVPFLAMAAAWAASRVWSWLPARARGALPSAAAFAGLLAFPSAVAWRVGTFRSEPDTFELTARWLDEHVDAEHEQVLLLQNFDLPLFYAADELASLNDSQTLYWTRFQRALAPEAFDGARRFQVERPPRGGGAAAEDDGDDDAGGFLEVISLEWLRARGYEYVVALPPSRGLRDPTALQLLRQLRKSMSRAAVFTPFVEDTRTRRNPDLGFGVTESGTVWHLLISERAGPRLEIFRL